MKEILIVLAVVAVIALMFAIHGHTRSSDRQEIDQWAIQNHHQIINVEECFFSIGPYWYKGKGNRIYEVTVENGITYWFRFGVWSYDVEKYP